LSITVVEFFEGSEGYVCSIETSDVLSRTRSFRNSFMWGYCSYYLSLSLFEKADEFRK